MKAIVLLSGTSYAAMEAVMYLIQPYLIDRGVEVGVLFSMLQVPTFVVGIGGGLLAARMQRQGRRLLIVLPAIGAGAYFALAAAPGLTAYAAFPVMYVWRDAVVGPPLGVRSVSHSSTLTLL